jgi:hypothetical protein
MSRRGTVPASYHPMPVDTASAIGRRLSAEILTARAPRRRLFLGRLVISISTAAQQPPPEAALGGRRLVTIHLLDRRPRRPRRNRRAGRRGGSRRGCGGLDGAVDRMRCGWLLLPAEVIRDLRHHAARLVRVAVHRRLGAAHEELGVHRRFTLELAVFVHDLRIAALLGRQLSGDPADGGGHDAGRRDDPAGLVALRRRLHERRAASPPS